MTSSELCLVLAGAAIGNSGGMLYSYIVEDCRKLTAPRKYLAIAYIAFNVTVGALLLLTGLRGS